MVLILLLISGLIIGPLLSYMGTGLITGEVYEKRTAELYAADAGVEDAIWRISHQSIEQWLWQESEDHPGWWVYEYPEPLMVNDRSVDVTLYRQDLDPTCGEDLRYRIISTAVTDDGGNTADITGTQIDAYITPIYGDLTGILDQVITSLSDYVLQGPTTVEPAEGEEHGPVNNYVGDWPEADDLADWYWQDVKNESPYTSDSLDVKDYAATGIGPLSRNGTLDIVNTGADDLTVSLNGTVYVTGDTLIGQTNQAFTLDLNGNTIFVESATIGGTGPGGPYALQIGTKCTVIGSGCIIAVGDIEFKPNLDCSEDDYILVMSVEGQTYMQPNGDFYGTLAGESEVYIQNGEARWNDPYSVEGGLNFPGFTEDKSIYYIIASWEVIPLWRE